MRRRFDAPLALLSAAWLAGCATSALEMAPDRPDQPWTPATTESGEIIPGKRGVPSVATGAGYVLPSNAAVAGVPPPPAVDASKVYALPDLIDIAEANNPSTRIAWNEARKVALAAGIAESAYLPKITASAVLADVNGGSSHGEFSGTGFQSNASATGDSADIYAMSNPGAGPVVKFAPTIRARPATRGAVTAAISSAPAATRSVICAVTVWTSSLCNPP